MVSILQGDGGSPCHFCTSTTAELNDVIIILQGFAITKSFESCMETWNKLEDGDLAWNSDQRNGQCHKPMAEVKFQGILHWKLRAFDFLLQIFYRLISGVYVWGDKKENARQNYEKLLQDINIMFSVTQGIRGDHPWGDVNTDKLKQLGIDIMAYLRTAFLNNSRKPWININPSLHQMCAHGWELFKICDGPIARFSEQSQEHWNKHVSGFKSGAGTRARQHNVQVNIQDIFGRMLMMTHPRVAVTKRQLYCSTCKQTGHTARSIIHHACGPVKQEAALINSYYLS